jgi:hypothetical protein
MRRLVMIAALLGAVASVAATAASAEGVSPAQLAQAGWSCFLPPPSTPTSTVRLPDSWRVSSPVRQQQRRFSPSGRMI